MNTNTPNTAPGHNVETPMASTEAIVTHPGQTTEASTEIKDALGDCILAIKKNDLEAKWDAIIKLDQVIKKEKKHEEEGKGREEKKMVMATDMQKKEQKEKEKEDDNITTTAVTTVAPTKTQIPAPETAHQTSPGPLGVERNPTPSPITHQKITTTSKVRKAPRAKTPGEMLQRSRRRSLRITESSQKSGQGKPAVASTPREERPTMTRPVKKTIEGPSGQIPLKTEARVVLEKEKEGPANAATKANSPTLKPRAGAGVTKKTIVRDSRGRIVGKAKGNGGVEKIKSTAVATTTDKATEEPRTRDPPEVLRPRRRSMRIIESMKKSARKEGESAVDTLAEGRKVSGAGPKRMIAVAVLIIVKSPILKPKEGAGVSKRGGRGGK